ncbi:glycosyltransferase [Shouchella shacheensis]|uniref:glycosyltransferase n=1 Tax=Shouchella shacheensis TaxID=1649580 RepID=UPI00073FE369|nr:glycosyltransferase [Shouchella shacheensis]
MKEKVCFLVSEHPFLDARIFKKEAKSLSMKGYDVTLIVPRRNGHLFDIDGTAFTDTFTESTFIHEGIKIVTYEQKHSEKNIKTYHYNIQSRGFHRFNDQLTRLGVAQEADIYHAHEFLSFYSGIGIKRTLGAKGKQVKIIYDSHELVPDPKTLEGAAIKKRMKQTLEIMLKEVDYVITVSESIKSWYRSIHPTLPIEVIYNSPPLTPHYEKKLYDKNRLVIGYEGTINKNKGNPQKLMEIVEACNKKFGLRAKIIGGCTDSHWIVPSHLEDKVEMAGWIRYESIPDAMKKIDIGWIDLDVRNSLNRTFAMPNKFFSYLNNGIPVLTNKCVDMERFIQRHQCGVVVNKENASADDYADALAFLFENKSKLRELSENARKVMEEQYSWEHMTNRLYSVYKRVATRN